MPLVTETAVVAHCLGPFRLEIAGRPVEHWRAGKARALFQYLLINRGRTVHRDRLHQVLWPESTNRGSSSLKVAVHAVRRVIGAHEVEGGPVLYYRDHGYLLWIDSASIDLEEFERAFEEGRRAWAAKDHAVALERFRRAAELYTGDFLAGEDGDWIDEQRQWTRGIALRAMTTLRADALEREDWPEAMHWCRRILDLDPCHEDTYRVLMMMHGELGEIGRVRDWYEQCRRRLRDDLDVAPAERTEQLAAVLMRGPASRTPKLSLARPAAV
ncbi:MAG TPA: BTAD domain-containing putative transcriptional regulator [Thermobifida alba]|jgi:two-component SAPR family response regulator|nr:BTAD domain-containing putative transcriptional regulator [Thermobifida alba]